jgi:hypothetical protein
MHEETYSLQRVLALRKLTRAISDLLRGQLKEYLATLGPALRPKNVLGDYVQGTAREAPRGPERAFKELQDLYHAVTAAKPFSFNRELTPPLEIANTVPELVAVEYTHTVGSKPVQVTSPLEWVLTYSGFTLARLKELLASRAADAEIQRFVLHYCVIGTVMSRQPGVAHMLEALRFPVRTVKAPQFGELPLTIVASPISTVRPPDDVIIDTTELSGKDVFEEIVRIDDLRAIKDPLKEQLLAIAAGFDQG